MNIYPAFCSPPKESATKACVLLHEYLLTETNSFMQPLQDEILHQQFLLAVSIKLIFSFALFMLQQILSEITTLYSHTAKISPGMQDIGR